MLHRTLCSQFFGRCGRLKPFATATLSLGLVSLSVPLPSTNCASSSIVGITVASSLPVVAFATSTSSSSGFQSSTKRSSETCDSTESSVLGNMSPNIRVVPNKKLYVSEPNPMMFGNGPNETNDSSWTNDNWLKSRFHFSFAEYSSAKNLDYGVLRVMNDDLVQPHRGFGTHPHRDMEIITYIVHGQLTHQDSMGTKESLGRGSIQFMTAGTGVRHSEFNHGDKPLRFIQTWIKPSAYGLPVNYGSYASTDCGSERKNKLHHLASNVKDLSTSTPVEVNQDVDAYASELDMGEKVVLELPPKRMAYLLCIEGEVKVNGKQLLKYDACEIDGKGGAIEIEATNVEETEGGKVAHILVFTMAEKPGAGRGDL